MKRIASLSLLAILPALAQQPKFDVADVHASTTWRGFVQNFGGVVRDGRYINRDATMLNLIREAYGVSEDVVAGGPNWLEADLFDVIAKVPAGTTPATANLMLQALLADRFGLVVRHETHPVPRYILSVGKGGSKLKPAGGSDDSGCKLKSGGRRQCHSGRFGFGTQHHSCLPQPDSGADRGQPASNGGRLFGSRRNRFHQARRLVGL